MIIEKLQQFAEAVSARLYVKRPAPIEQDWRLDNWQMPCFVALPAQESEVVQGVSGRTERREVQIMALRSVDVTFDTSEADTATALARTAVMDFAQQLRAVFHVEHLGGRQIWDSANGGLIVGWSLRLDLTELVGESACGGEPEPAEIEITENGTYNVLPFGRAVVDVQGGSPAVIEPLSVTPDYDPHTFTPSAGVDGFAPVEVAACPIPQTETLHVTPTNSPQQFTPSAGNIGFNLVDVDAAPAPQLVACPVTPTTSVQHITPPTGADGFSEVDVQAVDASIDSDIQPINIRQGVDILGVTGSLQEITKQPLNITPSTSAQTYTAPSGEAYDPVQVDAVTASIDPNITAENIKSGVSILGVTGTMEPKVTTGDRLVLYDIQDITADGLEIYTGTVATTLDLSWTQNNRVVKEYEINGVTAFVNGQWQGASVRKITAKSITTLGSGMLVQGGLRWVEVGKLTSCTNTTLMSGMANLRCFSVGQDTDISLPWQRWTATNVIAEGQSGIDELNYNITTYLADRVKDNSGGGPTRTITFGTALYNVLTADTIAAFTNKGWSVAYA